MNDTCALSTYRQRTREFYYTPASGKYKDRTPTRLLPIVSWLRCPKPFMTRSWVDVDAARLAMSLVKQVYSGTKKKSLEMGEQCSA